jgi:hypothetical protein
MMLPRFMMSARAFKKLVVALGLTPEPTRGR